MESQRLPRSRNFYRAPSSTDHPPILFSLSRRHLFGRSKGMTTGGKWLALPLIFRDRPLETFAPKNPIGRSIGFVRSDFRVQTFARELLAVDFWVRRSWVVDRGSGAPFTPRRHSLGRKFSQTHFSTFSRIESPPLI